ncbi:dihydrofolate reductase [Rhodobacter sp. SGA-6-6]|uniref:dihydrofolate reductase family protein n=1 Tax=Rhodobacter sp. SGA-6-6 TaxID=2710882 RepID=UPI0013EC5A12|nr:dihydrofolate reductase family protein [Rhodobacter sp. SGA-6-6]NGM46421.1 dihydrofolate reductase [Rhodobacter sp. SGA-6-6]
MTVWHCHIAVSLDGKIARPDGGVEDWLVADYPPEGLGFEEFYAGVGAILMGRGTYDAAAGQDWPYAGKAVTVLTSRPLEAPPPGVRVRSGDLAAVAAELEAEGHGTVWVEGGGQVIRGMMAIGKLDILEMAVIPIILGDGIPLFPPGTPELKLELDFARPWRKGAIHVKYRRAAATA